MRHVRHKLYNFRQNKISHISYACLCHPHQPSYGGKEDDSFHNYLRAPKPVPIDVTSCLAYSSTIFIGLDGLHPHLYYPSIVELIGQKM